MGKIQLNKFLLEARKLNADVIGYLVVPTNKVPFFKIINPEIENTNKNSVDLNYQNQVVRSRSAKTEIIKTKKVETVDEFKKKINILLFVLSIIFVLDNYCFLELNNIRFYLIVIMIVLYILPYYEEIKISNLELKKKHINTDTK